MLIDAREIHALFTNCELLISLMSRNMLSVLKLAFCLFNFPARFPLVLYP